MTTQKQEEIANSVLKNIDIFLHGLTKEDGLWLVENVKAIGCSDTENQMYANYKKLIELFGEACRFHDGTRFPVLLYCAETLGLSGNDNIHNMIRKKIQFFFGLPKTYNSDDSPNCCFF